MNGLVNCCTIVTFLMAGFGIEGADDPPLTTDQQLVVAAFELDVKRVESLLEGGANPNARFGSYKGQSLFQELFKDKWTLGTPMASNKWTPLLAVASSHREPQPEKPAEKTLDGRALAIQQRDAIDPKLIARDRGPLRACWSDGDSPTTSWLMPGSYPAIARPERSDRDCPPRHRDAKT